MQAYPSTLPAPLVSGYTLSPVDQTVRTDMEVGAARVRRRTRARNDLIDVSFLLTAAQMDEFREWFDGYEWQRKNLFLHSADCDSANGWNIGSNLTRVGKTTAPDGSNSATVYTGTVFGDAWIGQSVDLSLNTSYTLSVWAKLISGSAPSSGSLLVSDHDIDGSGVVMAGERTLLGWAGISSTWKRFELPFTNAGAVTAMQYLCTDFANGAHIAVWGAQIEPRLLASEFINTDGSPVVINETYGIAGGTSWFDMAIDVGSGPAVAREVRFKGPWKATRDSSMWRVTAQIEVR